VKLDFQSQRMAKRCETDRSRSTAFGAQRAKLLKKRLSALIAASNLEELRNAPGRLHPLKGDRAGQLSLDLDGPYRLIFEPVASTRASQGSVPWGQVTRVRILSIEDTHD
jgi:plasmid maintenance system killer protein